MSPHPAPLTHTFRQWFDRQLSRGEKANHSSLVSSSARSEMRRRVAQTMRFFSEYGHFNIPRVGSTATLGEWMHSMLLLQHERPHHRDLRQLKKLSRDLALHLALQVSAAPAQPSSSRRVCFEDHAQAWIDFVSRSHRLPYTDGATEDERSVAFWESSFIDAQYTPLGAERRALLTEIGVIRKGLEARMHPDKLLSPSMAQRLSQLLSASRQANPFVPVGSLGKSETTYESPISLPTVPDASPIWRGPAEQ